MDMKDASALFEIYGDPTVMQYTDEKPFENVATVMTMLRSVQTLLQEGRSLEWAIVPAGEEVPIGTCGIHSLDPSRRMAEVGCLLKQSAWGNGYMKEAVKLLMMYARDSLRLTQLLADVDDDNSRAQKLFMTLGFQRAGRESWIVHLI